MSDAALPDPTTRKFITASVMAATVMNSLDSTIANVALPHMQGSVSASADQITWVLTSYIVAAAIVTPLTGWLAGRFGRKRLMLYSIVGFTIASGLGIQTPPVRTIALAGVRDWKFLLPVFIGDTIRSVTEVRSRRESKSRPDWGIVTFEHRGINQRGEVVCTCVRNGAMLKRPAASPDPDNTATGQG